MAAVSLGRSIPITPKQPELELKSVFGEGREGRWETVQKVFAQQIDGELLKELPKSDSLKTRLLVLGKEPIGVLVYKSASEDPFQKRLGRCLEVKVLYANEKRPDATDFLLKHLLEIANDHHVNSLCVKVSKQTPLISFLEKNQFQAIEERDAQVLYSRKIEDVGNGDRKRKMDDESRKSGKEEKKYDQPHTLPRSPLEEDKRKREKEDDEVPAYKKGRKESKEAPFSFQSPGPHVAQLRNRFEHMSSPPPQFAPLPSPASREFNGIPKVQSSKAIAAGRELLEQARRQHDSCPLKMVYLRMILQGTKTIEGRINSGPFRNLREGRFIRFFSQQTEAFCQVTKVVSYRSFAEMLQTEGVEPCLPDVVSLDAGIRVYDSIPGYADKAKKFGVLAIHIRLLQ